MLITGLGAICCLGTGRDALWRGLLAGGGRPRPVRDWSAYMRCATMYLVPEDDVPQAPETFAHVPVAPGPRFGVAAAREAIADAGLDPVTVRDLPVVLGVEMGNSQMHEDRRQEPRDRPARSEPARWTPLMVTSAVVATEIGSEAVNTSVGNACAASSYAVTIGADMIRAGEADLVLVGGAEGATRVGMGAFNRLGALDPLTCRPFDRYRQGTVFGEGAAMVVLESAEHAVRRGAAGYAEVAAACWSCDAHHPTAPDPQATQVVRGMRQVLREAGVPPDRVGAVVPHGTGTPLNDVVEARALGEVFGSRCGRLPLLNLKAMIGHTAGVAGVMACAVAALMLHFGHLPANPPLDEQDPDCPVWIPQDGPVPLVDAAVLVNAYAFGGNNASIVLTSPGTRR